MSHRAATAVRPTPAWVRAHHSLVLPAFWLLVLLLVAGGWQVVSMIHLGATAYPLATARLRNSAPTAGTTRTATRTQFIARPASRAGRFAPALSP